VPDQFTKTTGFPPVIEYYSRMQNETNPIGGDPVHDRVDLVRDIAVLQVKLIVDGLRDFILVPISLVAGVISLFRAGDPAGSEFYNLLRIGKKSERFINLFGAADRAREPEIDRVRFPDDDIDTLVKRVETFVVDEYRRGGVTKQAKDQLDQVLRSLHRRARRDDPADS
jgi:hypothetical protein